jgi:sulfate-transporting ATPase
LTAVPIAGSWIGSRNSQVSFFDGIYQEYEADKKKRLGEEGAKPKRIRYKPIAR